MKQLIYFILFFCVNMFTVVNVFAQNVGIGTATPSKPLTVKADGIGLSQESSTGGAKIGFYTSGTNAYVQTHNAVDLKFATNDSTFSMILKRGSGNLGIGQPNPTAKLDVNGTVKITDGNQGDGKVLTSDAAGNATWQNSAYGSLQRFHFLINNTQNDYNSVLTTVYNYGSTTVGNGSSNNEYYDGQLNLTINSPGLYHFDVNGLCKIPNGVGNELFSLVINCYQPSFALLEMKSITRTGGSGVNLGYTIGNIDKSFDLYIPTARTINFFFYTADQTIQSVFNTNLNVTGHKIAD